MIIKPHKSYDEYTTNQILLNHKKSSSRELGTFEQRTGMFRKFFQQNRLSQWFQPGETALCLGARRGEEVAALRERGLLAVGIDLVECPPYVLYGDFHKLPFEDNTFSRVFSNSVDHLKSPEKFIGEIQRVLKPGGVVVLALMIGMDSDEMTFLIENEHECRKFVDLFVGSYTMHLEVPKVTIADENMLFVWRHLL